MSMNVLTKIKVQGCVCERDKKYYFKQSKAVNGK